MVTRTYWNAAYDAENPGLRPRISGSVSLRRLHRHLFRLRFWSSDSLIECFKSCSYLSTFKGCCKDESEAFWDCYTRTRVGFMGGQAVADAGRCQVSVMEEGALCAPFAEY